MATSETVYSKAPLENQESQCTVGPCVPKLGIISFSILAIFAPIWGLLSTSVATSSTSLIALPPPLRTPGHMIHQTTADLLPGASPWKELALAGIQEANRCGSRDFSTNANGVKHVLATMSNASKESVKVAVSAAEEAVEEWMGKAPEEILKAGATAPFGYWDPLGFAIDETESRLLFYREAELKHGRVCMLASLGFLVAEKFHPLFGGNIDVPSYVAFQATPLQTFWQVVAVAVAIPEILFSIPTFNEPSDSVDLAFSMKSKRVPGDLGFDPLGLKPSNEQELLDLQNKELNNGRLAMIGTAGMIAQELATGQKIFP